MQWRTAVGGFVVALLAGLVLSVGASAAPGGEASIGPVVVPEGPLQVCIGDRCEMTPDVTAVSLALSAAPQAGMAGTAPTITEARCASGFGVAAKILGGSAGTTVTGTLTLMVSGGTSVALPLRRTMPVGAGPLVISACTAS